MNPTVDLGTAFQQLGISLALGLLIGLQRERVADQLAGFRTFALVALFGTITAQLSGALGGWIVAAGLVGLVGIIVAGNLLRLREPGADTGQTTEVALLLTFGVGVYLGVGPPAVAIAVGAGTAVLLWAKPQLHGLAGKIGEDDFRAIMRFVLISGVILPILPNRAYGPFSVLNPQQIWWMVVLVVGIGLAAYVAYKLLGNRRGTLVAGLLGGAVSSTATTVGAARRTKKTPEASGAAAIVVCLAAGVVFLRVLLEIAVAAPAFLAVAAVPFSALLALFLLLAALLWKRQSRESEPLPPHENPSELKPALLFGLLYGIVLFATAAAREYFGVRGLYAVSALSGLTDVDAITLSTARLVRTAQLDPAIGWRLILVALLSNLLFKGAVIAVLGSRRLLARIAGPFLLALAVGVLLLLFGAGF
jgi:uncharacterized membrane protein (DUF4010 family)